MNMKIEDKEKSEKKKKRDRERRSVVCCFNKLVDEELCSN